jgi:PadR family transcriptional regulator, regulatory protein PadR
MAFKSDLDAMILGVLQGEALHGYEIAKRIRLASAKTLKIGEGQLYPALHKLEEEGRIQAEWVPQEGKPARKVYKLTKQGHAKLAEHRQAWDEFSAGVGAVLSGSQAAKEGYRG